MPEGVNQRPGNMATVRERFAEWDPRCQPNIVIKELDTDREQDFEDVRSHWRSIRVEGKLSSCPSKN